MNIFSSIGTIVLILSGLPQLFKVIHDGHANGLSAGMLWCWLIGLTCMFIYIFTIYPNDFILLINYGLNVCVTIGLLRYKYFPEKNDTMDLSRKTGL